MAQNFVVVSIVHIHIAHDGGCRACPSACGRKRVNLVYIKVHACASVRPVWILTSISLTHSVHISIQILCSPPYVYMYAASFLLPERDDERRNHLEVLVLVSFVHDVHFFRPMDMHRCLLSGLSCCLGLARLSSIRHSSRWDMLYSWLVRSPHFPVRPLPGQRGARELFPQPVSSSFGACSVPDTAEAELSFCPIPWRGTASLHIHIYSVPKNHDSSESRGCGT